jgi:hypothetical protein
MSNILAILARWLGTAHHRLMAMLPDPWSAEFGPAFGGGGAPPVVTPSANDAVVVAGSTAAITDSHGNKWTITTAGKIAENGVTDPITQSVIKLAYVSGVVWQENVSGYWYSKTAGGWSPPTTKSPLPIVPPSQVTNVHMTSMTATSVTLAWKAPATGTPPFKFTVYFRKTGTMPYSVGATSALTTATVHNLTPKTSYQFEVAASN